MRFLLALTLLCSVLLVPAPPAAAQSPLDEPDCGDGGYGQQGELEVSAQPADLVILSSTFNDCGPQGGCSDPGFGYDEATWCVLPECDYAPTPLVDLALRLVQCADYTWNPDYIAKYPFAWYNIVDVYVEAVVCDIVWSETPVVCVP